MSRLMCLSTSMGPKDLTRPWMEIAGVWVGADCVMWSSPGLCVADLETADELGQRQRDHQVQQTTDHQRSGTRVLHHFALAELGELVLAEGDAEHVDQRGVLDQQDDLVGQRWDDDAER